MLMGLWAALGCEPSDTPQDPFWGKQACADCGMSIVDKRFAAQSLEADGEHLFFDDLGCLLHHLEQHKRAIRRGWVKDAKSSRWLDIGEARYAAGARTPMDYGFEASADSGDLGLEDVRGAIGRRQGRM